MTRVAVFSDTDLLCQDNLTSTLKAVLRLAAPEFGVRVFTTGDLATDTPGYFAAASPHFDLPWRRQRVYWPRVVPFVRQLRAARPHVVHIASAGPVGLVGAWLARRWDLPVVGSLHHTERPTATRFSARVRGERLRWAYARAERVLVSGQTARSHLVSYGLRNAARWERGVDTHKFCPERASARLREAWHVDARRPAVIVPVQHLTAVDADAIGSIRHALHRHAVSHQFVFTGVLPRGSRVRDCCPDGIFIDGLGDDERLATVLAAGDLCLLLGGSEAADNQSLEARACGLPVVARVDGPIWPSALRTAGWCAGATSVGDLASSLLVLLRSERQRRDAGQQARQFAVSRQWARALEPLFAAWREARASAPARARNAPREAPGSQAAMGAIQFD